ncbi:hypothetical protein JTB14_036071 [Gonioctena quinquepunctata]|nr:hypothetical protein JTB14_036071 [Gonioctena quinquepunctata]
MYSDTTRQRKRRKKVDVEAGKRVSGADFQGEAETEIEGADDDPCLPDDTRDEDDEDNEVLELNEEEEVLELNEEEESLQSDTDEEISMSSAEIAAKFGNKSIPRISYECRVFKHIFPVLKEFIRISYGCWLPSQRVLGK